MLEPCPPEEKVKPIPLPQTERPRPEGLIIQGEKIEVAEGKK